jgi:hypothetical protein
MKLCEERGNSRYSFPNFPNTDTKNRYKFFAYMNEDEKNKIQKIKNDLKMRKLNP